MNTEFEFEIFRKNFLATKVMVYQDEMVYKVRRGFAKSVAEEANKIIEKLGLDLVAIPSPLSSADSVVIQSQYSII